MKANTQLLLLILAGASDARAETAVFGNLTPDSEDVSFYVNGNSIGNLQPNSIAPINIDGGDLATFGETRRHGRDSGFGRGSRLSGHVALRSIYLPCGGWAQSAIQVSDERWGGIQSSHK
jgi:hypothetical protein